MFGTSAGVQILPDRSSATSARLSHQHPISLQVPYAPLNPTPGLGHALVVNVSDAVQVRIAQIPTHTGTVP